MNEHVTGDPWPDKLTRERRLVESVDVMRRLLAGEEVSHRGEVVVHRVTLPLPGGLPVNPAARRVVRPLLREGRFDVVHAHQVLHHLARPVDALREFRRVAGPDGLVAVRETDYAGWVMYPETPGLLAWRTLYQRVHRSHGGEPDAGRRLKSWARAAGFAEVQAAGSSWYFSDDEDREFWGGMWADRALQSAFAGDALALGSTQEELQAISDAWRAWVDDPDGWLMVTAGEILARG